MEVTIGILGFIIVMIAVEYFFFHKRKEEKEEEKEEEYIDPLEVRFKATQKLSKEVQLDIENYILKANASDKLLFKDMTFSKYLAHLKETHNENLSDSLYERLRSLELTKSNSVFLIKSLEFQFSALLQIKNKMQLLDLLYSKRVALAESQH
ncbi:hypothetical protein C8N46_105172 [Kordia periserrulae]|uniref:Uncharacterized protein n=1 Tax=Kordia periserrulae TaxID=701523 RepID=A0A2T6BYA3_9FLAO|nr:hypothetical protein [Kordia periserrulae]PTX61016.1 hypothetical protein C8N46_105172 [Kordia periserrulae]